MLVKPFRLPVLISAAKMQHNRAPPPAYPEKLTIALLGKKIQIKNVIGNLILNDQRYFNSESDTLVVGENMSVRVINTPDFFDAECPNPDQRIIDFMALSHPGLDLFILVLDPENAREEKVVGQISKLQDVFGEQITKHLVVMFPDLECLRALAHLKEMFNVLLVVRHDDLPTQCRKWFPRGHPFVYQYKDYSQSVVLRRRAAIEKRRANHSCGSGDPDETGPATLQRYFATAAPISPSVLSVPDDIFNIVLLGLTGTGKSSSANTILYTGKSKQEITPFRSEASSIPVTNICDVRVMYKPFGVPVRLVDTPDFFCEDLRNPEPHLEVCRRYCQPGRAVVLLVVQLGRFTDGERGILPKLEERLGWRIREETILLLTHRDDLKGNLLSHVQTHPDLKGLAEMCGLGFHAFNNKLQNNKQVIELVKKIPNYKQRFPKIAKTEDDSCHLS